MPFTIKAEAVAGAVVQVMTEGQVEGQVEAVDGVVHCGRSSSQEVGQSCGASAANSQPCNNCGHVVHNFHVCPAADVTCFHCKKKGYYARKCKSKKCMTIFISRP